MIVECIGVLMIVTGIFDAIKYHWHSTKIKQVHTAKGHSRKFINVAILNDLVRICYGIVKGDLYILLSSFLAFIYMMDYFITIYRYYPYRNRNLINFKRPNIFLYFVNSLLPNKLRRRL